MNKAITTLVVCIPMLTACFNDEPRIVQVPVPAAPIAAPVAAPVAAPIQAEEPRVVEVLSTTPNYREVSAPPRQGCKMVEVPVNYEETVQVGKEVPNDNSGHPVIGTVMGGAIGTAVGNQIGNGNGREVARVALGILGAVVGNRAGTAPATKMVSVMQTVQRTRYEQQQQCETVNETSREVENYTVTFNYKGQPVTTVMPYNPGPNLVLGMAGNGGR